MIALMAQIAELAASIGELKGELNAAKEENKYLRDQLSKYIDTKTNIVCVKD
jgi:regulator of replication initiation timing